MMQSVLFKQCRDMRVNSRTAMTKASSPRPSGLSVERRRTDYIFQILPNLESLTATICTKDPSAWLPSSGHYGQFGRFDANFFKEIKATIGSRSRPGDDLLLADPVGPSGLKGQGLDDQDSSLAVAAIQWASGAACGHFLASLADSGSNPTRSQPFLACSPDPA
jgi:hypothetical protein